MAKKDAVGFTSMLVNDDSGIGIVTYCSSSVSEQALKMTNNGS
jgi:hypothetical protein